RVVGDRRHDAVPVILDLRKKRRKTARGVRVSRDLTGWVGHGLQVSLRGIGVLDRATSRVLDGADPAVRSPKDVEVAAGAGCVRDLLDSAVTVVGYVERIAELVQAREPRTVRPIMDSGPRAPGRPVIGPIAVANQGVVPVHR